MIGIWRPSLNIFLWETMQIYPTYNKRQGKIFRCDAISQKLDDPES